MPLAVENLTKNSSMAAIREAISKTIEYLIKHEGKSRKDAAGQAYGMARDKTGKELRSGK